MSRHFRRIVPILVDADHYLFSGPGIDALLAHSEAAAQDIAAELNGDRQTFGVIRFNGVEGTCRDVSADFIPDEDDLPEYPAHDRACSASDRAHQSRKEAF